jgi:succinate dehydrogenase flavin-adding protein (antitoxin of CptAB toxin-antitoxin module)
MLELDLALERFLSKHYEHLSPRECESLETLLATNDVELLRWLQGEADPIDSELRELVTKIR